MRFEIEHTYVVEVDSVQAAEEIEDRVNDYIGEQSGLIIDPRDRSWWHSAIGGIDEESQQALRERAVELGL